MVPGGRDKDLILDRAATNTDKQKNKETILQNPILSDTWSGNYQITTTDINRQDLGKKRMVPNPVDTGNDDRRQLSTGDFRKLRSLNQLHRTRRSDTARNAHKLVKRV